jgi:hypothetical protein
MKFRGSCLSLTKLADIESSIGSDRLATWNEVCRALSFSSQDATKPACDDFRETNSDFSGRTGNLPENDMWLAIVSEMPDSRSN